MRIETMVNGTPRSVTVPDRHTLLQLLRDELGLTGTKECCAEGECGACTVILDGRAVNSCLILAAEADGARIETIEGLNSNGGPSPLQRAFVEQGAVQCGFCIPGMIVAATCLLRSNPDPSEAEIQDALEGNLCRCAGYRQIIGAVRAAAAVRAEGDAGR